MRAILSTETREADAQSAAKRRKALGAHLEMIKVLLDQMRGMNKASVPAGTAGGSLDKLKLDSSVHWKATYVKLLTEVEKFAGSAHKAEAKALFNAYLERNEFYINYAKDKDFKKDIVAHIGDIRGSLAENKLVLETLTAMMGGAAGQEAAVEAQLGEALKKTNDSSMTFTRLEMANELTRILSLNQKEMIKTAHFLSKPFLQACSKHPHFLDALVGCSLALTRYNFILLREEVRKNILGHNDVQMNAILPMLFVNSKDRGLAQQAASPLIKVDKNAFTRLHPDVLRAFMMTELSIQDGYFWKWSIQRDMVQAIGMLGFRHAKRYEMGTMIILSAWSQTGNTFYGHADMMLADDAAKKMHYGHFTYNSKSQVLNSRKIVHGRNVVCKDYLGGNGHKVWDASDPDDLEDYLTGELTKDIFMVPVLMTHEVDTNHMDITGEYHEDIGAGEEANKATYYSSAEIYRQYWQWRNNVTPLTDNSFNAIRRPRDNTIVFQEHQHQYNPGSGKFDLTIMDKGHWGERVYPGCGKARRGMEMYLKPVKYDQTNTIGFAL